MYAEIVNLGIIEQKKFKSCVALVVHIVQGIVKKVNFKRCLALLQWNMSFKTVGGFICS